MSEYQRYEFMTVDRPLTRVQLEEVNDLSSHIEASSTHALIEYNYGDFKYDPLEVLRDYFDGFLYWANWGSPRLAFRFPHGLLPANLLDSYNFDTFFVTFTQYADYDILNILFGEMEGPDEWVEYELGPLMAMRDELLEGDVRSLYIVWLAYQNMMGNDDENETSSIPPVPPAFKTLTAAQQALAELLQVPEEMLGAAAQHSNVATSSTKDDFAAWVELLPQNRRREYLVRLAQNESGLSRLLVKELRELGQDKTKEVPVVGEHVTYATLLDESKSVKARLKREKQEQEQLARQRRLQDIHSQQEEYWRQARLAAERGTGAGYDEATRILIELREVAEHFKENQEFQARFRTWITSHLRRPAFLKRLQDKKFPMPQA